MSHDFLNFIIYLNICFYLLFVLPSSTTDPLLSTIIFDALTIVDKRCAITMVVRPFDARSRASCTTRSLSVSRALYTVKILNKSVYLIILFLHTVASSSKRIRGSRTSARAIAINII
jgi:hypothetical protein